MTLRKCFFYEEQSLAETTVINISVIRSKFSKRKFRNTSQENHLNNTHLTR
jgi:hypothetical protein